MSFFVGVWVARYLRPGPFGILNYAFAFAGLFIPLSYLGMDGIVVRNLVRDPLQKDRILGTAFGLRVAGGFFCVLITVGAIILMRPTDIFTRWLVVIFAVGSVFQAFDVIRFWFESQVQSKYIVYVRNTVLCTIALVKVGLILIRAPLIYFAWAGLLEIILLSIGFWIAYRMKGYQIKLWRWDLQQAIVLLRESWPLIISGVATLVYMKIDQVMLGDMIGDKEVGLYSAAARISELSYFIPVAIVSSVFPSIVEAKKKDEDLYYERIWKLFRLMTGISYSIAIPMTLLSKFIVSTLYGSDYAEAGTVLAIHIWAAIFIFLSVARGPWILNEGLMKISLYSTILGAILNVVLNLFLIPLYSIIGAAIATLISYAFAGFLFNAFMRETRKIFYMQIGALFFVPMLKQK
jgi:PST family polysaccharide transporter